MSAISSIGLNSPFAQYGLANVFNQPPPTAAPTAAPVTNPFYDPGRDTRDGYQRRPQGQGRGFYIPNIRDGAQARTVFSQYAAIPQGQPGSGNFQDFLSTLQHNTGSRDWENASDDALFDAMDQTFEANNEDNQKTNFSLGLDDIVGLGLSLAAPFAPNPFVGALLGGGGSLLSGGNPAQIGIGALGPFANLGGFPTDLANTVGQGVARFGDPLLRILESDVPPGVDVRDPTTFPPDTPTTTTPGGRIAPFFGPVLREIIRERQEDGGGGGNPGGGGSPRAPAPNPPRASRPGDIDVEGGTARSPVDPQPAPPPPAERDGPFFPNIFGINPNIFDSPQTPVPPTPPPPSVSDLRVDPRLSPGSSNAPPPSVADLRVDPRLSPGSSNAPPPGVSDLRGDGTTGDGTGTDGTGDGTDGDGTGDDGTGDGLPELPDLGGFGGSASSANFRVLGKNAGPRFGPSLLAPLLNRPIEERSTQDDVNKRLARLYPALGF